MAESVANYMDWYAPVQSVTGVGVPEPVRTHRILFEINPCFHRRPSNDL